jgi:hypothetical protein
MRREPIGWRRWVVSIGFSVLGLMALAMAGSIFFGGVIVAPQRRSLALRPWAAIRIESPVIQVILGACLAVVAVLLFRLGYKALREGRDAGEP